MNNFFTVCDSLKLQIRADFVLKQNVKLILSLNTTITFKLSNLHFIHHSHSQTAYWIWYPSKKFWIGHCRCACPMGGGSYSSYIYCCKNIQFYSFLCTKCLSNFCKLESFYNVSRNMFMKIGEGNVSLFFSWCCQNMSIVVENLKGHWNQVSLLSLSFTWYILYKFSKFLFVTLLFVSCNSGYYFSSTKLSGIWNTTSSSFSLKFC